MPAASLSAIVAYCDQTLQPAAFADAPGAVNGLQVENAGAVRKIAAAVDASLATVRLAVDARADLLIVHHGLFWSPTVPWTGKRREMLGLLVKHNLAVYSSHLPLDAHRRLGNNALLMAALGFRRLQPFFKSGPNWLGWRTRQKISRDDLARKLTAVLGKPPLLLPGGGPQCERIGVLTGGAGSEMKTAAAEGIDTYITGEGPHHTHAWAEDLGLNVFYGGHYATETFGVKALAAELSKKFRAPWEFLDHPSGL